MIQAAMLRVRSGVAASHSGLVVILGALSMAAPLSIDIYLPAAPSIGRDLGLGPTAVVATLSAFFLGFGLGQLVWGPLGDRFGRRRPMMAGSLLYVAASLGCAAAPSGAVLILCRFVQAIGGSAAPVLAQAIVRDLFDRRESARVLSLMLLVGNLAPLLAPSVGGLVLHWSHWRMIFAVLTLFGLLALLGAALLPETRPPETRRPARRRDMVVGYLGLVRDRRFLGYLFGSGLYGGGFFAWIAGSPIVFIGYYGILPEYFGLFFGAGVVAIIAANLLNRRLIARFDPDLVMRGGLIVATLAGIAAMLVARHPAGRLWLLAPFLWCFVGSQSLVMGNAVAGALAGFPERAGMAAALMGAMRAGTGALGGLLLGWLADGTPRPVALVIGLMSAAALAVTLTLVPVRHGRD